MAFHSIEETEHGLQLFVEGGPIATIRQRDGLLDLIWDIRGPQDLAKARAAITGLLDLLVVYDSMQKPEKPRSTHKEK